MTINDLIRVSDSMREMGGFFRDQLPDLLGEYPDQSAATYERAVIWARKNLDCNPDRALQTEVNRQLKKWLILLHKHPVWVRANAEGKR